MPGPPRSASRSRSRGPRHSSGAWVRTRGLVARAAPRSGRLSCPRDARSGLASRGPERFACGRGRQARGDGEGDGTVTSGWGGTVRGFRYGFSRLASGCRSPFHTDARPGTGRVESCGKGSRPSPCPHLDGRSDRRSGCVPWHPPGTVASLQGPDGGPGPGGWRQFVAGVGRDDVQLEPCGGPRPSRAPRRAPRPGRVIRGPRAGWRVRRSPCRSRPSAVRRRFGRHRCEGAWSMPSFGASGAEARWRICHQSGTGAGARGARSRSAVASFGHEAVRARCPGGARRRPMRPRSHARGKGERSVVNIRRDGIAADFNRTPGQLGDCDPMFNTAGGPTGALSRRGHGCGRSFRLAGVLNLRPRAAFDGTLARCGMASSPGKPRRRACIDRSCGRPMRRMSTGSSQRPEICACPLSYTGSRAR